MPGELLMSGKIHRRMHIEISCFGKSMEGIKYDMKF